MRSKTTPCDKLIASHQREYQWWATVPTHTHSLARSQEPKFSLSPPLPPIDSIRPDHPEGQPMSLTDWITKSVCLTRHTHNTEESERESFALFSLGLILLLLFPHSLPWVHLLYSIPSLFLPLLFRHLFTLHDGRVGYDGSCNRMWWRVTLHQRLHHSTSGLFNMNFSRSTGPLARESPTGVAPLPGPGR